MTRLFFQRIISGFTPHKHWSPDGAEPTCEKTPAPLIFQARPNLPTRSFRIEKFEEKDQEKIPNNQSLTPPAAELIKSDFVCEPRSTVYVKGKGEMEACQIHGDLEQ